MKKKIKEICGNCRLYNHEEGICKVAITIGEEKFNMPVFPEDKCHMDELGIPIEEIRWWVEDPLTGKLTDKNGVVKMQFPKNLKFWEGFFQNDKELKNKGIGGLFRSD
jgi:hypothetical protein